MGLEKSFLYCKSVANQRFKDTRDCGLYCDDDEVQVKCLKLCFMPVIRHELHKVAVLWNLHKIRPSTTQESPRNRRVFYHNVIHGLGLFICFMI